MMKYLVLLLSFIFPLFAHAHTFEEALEKIIARDTGIQYETHELDRIESQNLSDHYYFLPTVDLSGKRAISRFESQAWETTDTYSVTANLNFFKFGSDLYLSRSGEAEEEAQRQSLRNEKIQVESSAIRVMIDWITAERKVQILDKIVEGRSKSLRIANQRFKKGILPKQEVMSVQIDFENSVIQKVEAEKALEVSRIALQKKLGEGAIEKKWPWKDTLFSHNSRFPQQLLARSFRLESIPSWKKAKSEDDKELFLQKKTWRDLYFPSVDGAFDYSYQNGGTLDGNTWTATLSVSFPLFNQLSDYGSYKEQIAERKKTEILLEEETRASKARWESAKENLSHSWKTIQTREKTRALALRLYQDNLKRFRSGRSNANDLNIELRRLFETELLAEEGWSDLHLAWAELCHSLGMTIHECRSRE